MIKKLLKYLVCYYIHLSVAIISSEITIGIITSNLTPLSSLESLHTSQVLNIFNVTTIEISDLASENYEEFDFFIDFTYSNIYNNYFLTFSSQTGIPIILSDYGNTPIQQTSLVLNQNTDKIAESLKDLIIYLD